MSELQQRPLADFADVTMGQSPASDLCNTDGKGLPFLQGSAEFGRNHPSTTISCQPPLRVAKADSVLISVRAPVGSMNYANQDYCIGRGLGAFKAKPGLSDTVFLKHAVELNSNYLQRRSQGSTFAAVSTSDVRSIPIPTFAFGKQRKIANILSTIDTAIEKTEGLIEKYQHIKAGLMHDLFTRGVLESGQLRPPREQAPELYQETAIGWIPREWTIGKIGDLFDIQLGKMLNQLAKTGNNSFPYLGNRSVQWNKVEVSALEEMDFSVEEQTKFALKPDDLLVCEGGEVGRTAIWESQVENCYFQKAIHRLRVKDGRVKPRFMLWNMQFAKARDQFADFTSQSSIAHLTQEKLAGVPLRLPPVEEQISIVARIDQCESLLKAQHKYLANLSAQKLGLMQDLLTGKVAVKVEVFALESAHA